MSRGHFGAVAAMTANSDAIEVDKQNNTEDNSLHALVPSLIQVQKYLVENVSKYLFSRVPNEQTPLSDIEH